jgi:AraC-like DNA-binding protein
LTKCDAVLLWSAHFLTSRPVPSFPRLAIIASEEQTDTSYHHEGRFRTREHHGLFKYTLEGEGVFRDGEGEHRVREGSGFLCEICDPATAYYYPADGRSPWVFVYACFEGGNVTSMVRDMVARFGAVYHVPRRDAAVQRMLACQSAAAGEQTITAGEGARVVMDLLAALAATHERVEEREAENKLVARAVRMIRTSLGRPLNATELAAALGCSREHLSRVFRLQTGAAPYRYIMQEKVRSALNMLRSSSLSAKEVAARLGFAHPAHFTRVFRSFTGTTPSAYRSSGIGE